MALRATQVAAPGSAGTVFSLGSFYMGLFTLAFEGEYTREGERIEFERYFPSGSVTPLSVIFTGPAGNSLEYDRRNRKILVYGAANRELEDRARYNAAITEDRNIQAIVLVK